MDNVSVVQLRNSSQTRLQYLLPGFYWDFLPDKAQKVVIQVSVHKYTLIWDCVTRQPDMWTFTEPRPYVLPEIGEYIFGNIL